MRIFSLLFFVAFASLASLAQADINKLYNGHGGDFLWSSNTLLTPQTKVGGPTTDSPGSGTHYFEYNLVSDKPLGVKPVGTITNSAINSGNSLTLTQTVDQSVTSAFYLAQNRQLDVGQYTYYGFTVSQTQLYKVSFEFSGLFTSQATPTGSPFTYSYSYTGTDGNIFLYEQTQGPQNAMLKFSYSSGETGLINNQVIAPSQYGQPLERELTKYVLLEAGKVYQIDTFNYNYLGSDGIVTANSTMSSIVSISAVPEPTSLVLLGSCLSMAGVNALRKRRRLAATEVRA